MSDQAPAAIRAFLAVDPPPEVLEKMAVLQREQKKAISGVISWVRPEGMHLTLKFFGNIDPARIGDIAEVVRDKTSAQRKLSFEVRSLGVFPDANRPRVIWLGMKGDVEELRTLQKDIDRSLQKIGFPPEDKPFRPHLTLGRIKTPKGLIGLARAIEKGEDVSAGSFSCDRLILFKSELTSAVALYTRLAEFPFGG
ncbi:MAG: RNA 2',3'-cyclic phosphodiesterase [Smithellaceae bacterium]|nr:RNA 2',3'-cyclic phosphodiesterase [Smithellaceae bacterium]